MSNDIYDYPPILRSRDVMHIMSISRGILRKLCKQGTLTPFRIGEKGHPRFNREEVFAILSRGTQ